MKTTPTDTKPPAAEDPVEEVLGTVENVVFRSEDTNYTVCAVKVAGREEPVTVVGTCGAIWVGETLRAEGRWVRHPRHGYQFQAASITCIVPSSAKGIERYLASGLIRGIGKVMAARLVKHFDDQTLHVIDKESARLEEVDGVGPVRRQMIKESWIEQKAVRDIMIFLQGHGIGAAHAARIFRQYGGDAIAVVSANPYRLCREVWGIGFKTADGVARSLGIAPDSEMRARAGLVYTLDAMAEEGHCYGPVPQLLLEAQALLDIPVEVLAPAFEREVETGAIVREADRAFPANLHRAESRIADKLVRLADTPSPFKPIVTDKAVAWAEQRMQIAFACMQTEALQLALREKVSIITGGPGVGKTTIIRALVDVFKARNLRVVLGAPTGRAAKRMAEATGHEAKTLHRVLKYNPQTHQFEHNADVPMEAEVYILDEVSMIDAPLMGHFLAAMPDYGHLVLVGDTDQLPSVGPGNVLRDLIDSNTIPYRRLETIYRQEEGSLIVRNAHHVNRGEPLEIPPSDKPSDFYFIACEQPDDVVARMLDLVTRRIPRKFGFNPLTDIQVLTPMRRNQLGADNLNGVLQEALNPKGAEIQRFGRKYRVGDRVMQIRNNYDRDVFNGDVGSIEKVDPEEHALAVRFDDRPVIYDFEDLDELVHAYACSIHKSQGSEYPATVVLLSTQHYKLLQRNLLYTALTRGKRLVCLVASHKAVHIAIKNNEIRLRRTALAERLRARLAPVPGQRRLPDPEEA